MPTIQVMTMARVALAETNGRGTRVIDKRKILCIVLADLVEDVDPTLVATCDGCGYRSSEESA